MRSRIRAMLPDGRDAVPASDRAVPETRDPFPAARDALPEPLDPLPAPDM